MTTFRERGFAAIAGIFILVVLALLGAYLVSIFAGQSRTLAFDALGAKALQSARAGLELGMYEAIRNSSCPASTTLALGGMLDGFSVRVQCQSSTHVEVAPPAIVVYQLTATACNRGACPDTADATYVERELRATVGAPPP
ncbi:MAG: agglutinin biogenesis protein MshP [Burkholderiales bacterium]|nr:agglutinin biogenesis protein MshP [Burkholderiales bacterium]